MDLAALRLTDAQISRLVAATDTKNGQPSWTYSDIRTRLYPAALAVAFPHKPLEFDYLRSVASNMQPSPVMEDQ